MHITIAYHGYDGSSLHTPFKKGLKDQSKEFNDLIVKKLQEKGIAVEYQQPKSKLTDELKRGLTFLGYTNEGEMIVLAKDKSTHTLNSKDIRELQAKYNLQEGDKFDYCVTKTKTPKMKDGKKVYYGGKLQYETKRDFSNIIRREELERSIAKENKAKEQRDKEWEEFLRQQKLEKEAWEADFERKEAEIRKAKEEAWKRACDEAWEREARKIEEEKAKESTKTTKAEKAESQDTSDTYSIEYRGKTIKVTDIDDKTYEVIEKSGIKILGAEIKLTPPTPTRPTQSQGNQTTRIITPKKGFGRD
ncbi:hypothetical protein [uncultured Campylobacter sp.]|uniref:hypothetical protein n=1 Tax=uncultured Campylobacter sp. TaxID=218934 RepID=UPI002601A1C3|nr:hypothetical protein [uncultured Campylobacter sp.]